MGVVLIKKGSEEHIRALMDEGIVFMRRLVGYTTMESKVVGDPNEGLLMHFPRENPTVKIILNLPGGKDLHLTDASVRIADPRRRHGAYCMYAMDVGNRKSVNLYPTAKFLMEDAQMGEFGDCFVCFRDTRQFRHRLILAAKAAGYNLSHGPVEYVPLTHAGDMGPFRKFEPYAYQREWRVVTDKPITEAHLILKLGSLKDICFMMRP